MPSRRRPETTYVMSNERNEIRLERTVLTWRVVLPGRRILKGVAEVFKRCEAGSEPEVKAVGNKRRRAIDSGAEEMLEEHDGEEDEDDEDILTKKIIVRHVSLTSSPSHDSSEDEQGAVLVSGRDKSDVVMNGHV